MTGRHEDHGPEQRDQLGEVLDQIRSAHAAASTELKHLILSARAAAADLARAAEKALRPAREGDDGERS